MDASALSKCPVADQPCTPQEGFPSIRHIMPHLSISSHLEFVRIHDGFQIAQKPLLALESDTREHLHLR